MLRERRRHANYKPNRRLDRKSSRGMIYENEELRLRTININAEVERGQSDIRKLRRENEQLKREIWSLRDEYERINKKNCANKNCSSCENISNSGSQSEDSDGCEMCKGSDTLDTSASSTTKHCTHKCDDRNALSVIHSEQSDGVESSSDYGIICNTNDEIVENYENVQKTMASAAASSGTLSILTSTATASTSSLSLASPSSPQSPAVVAKHCCKVPPSMDTVTSKLRENLHVNFGQLSVLSEENLTNSDATSSVNGEIDANSRLNSSSSISSLSQQIATTAAAESSTIPLNEIQSILPPLSHFENISFETFLLPKEKCHETDLKATHGEYIEMAADIMEQSKQTSSSSVALQQPFHSPKHFFSPINPRLKRQIVVAPSTSANPPDLFVANALASPCHLPPPPVQSACAGGAAAANVLNAAEHSNNHLLTTIPLQYSNESSFYDGNLDDLLLEIETLQIQLEKYKSFSQEKLSTNEPFSTRKPYRSEMNLVVSCNGCKSSITPITKQTSNSMSTDFDHKSDYFRKNSFLLETPPPNLPQPMILFPQNLTYLSTVADTTTRHDSVPTNTDVTKCPPLRFVAPIVPNNSSDQLNVMTVTTNGQIASALKVKDATECVDAIVGLEPRASVVVDPGTQSNFDYPRAASKTTTNTSSHITKKSIDNNSIERSSLKVSMVDGKKNLASSLRKTTTNCVNDMKKSQGTNEKRYDAATSAEGSRYTSDAIDNFQNESTSDTDKTKRKITRRLSISFSDTRTRDLIKDDKAGDHSADDNVKNKAVAEQSSTGVNMSMSDFPKNHKTPSELVTQSTPNSPYFSGRRQSGLAGGSSGHSHHHHHHPAHHCSRKSSMDSIKVSRKCSRRFSEGTVDTLPYSSFGSAYGGSVSCSDSRRHPNSNEPANSVSERNSNSFASSRESSTSQSTHSQRRKLSISSHNGGKIPWCGCWGNGCL